MTYAQVARGRVFYKTYYEDELKKKKKEVQALARREREKNNDETQHAITEYRNLRGRASASVVHSDTHSIGSDTNISSSSSSSSSSSGISSSSSSSSSISYDDTSNSTSTNDVTKESILLQFKTLFSAYNNEPLSKEIILNYFNDLDAQYSTLFNTGLKSITSRSEGIFTLLCNSFPVQPVLTFRERTVNQLEELFSTSIGNRISMQHIVDHFPNMEGDDECTLGEVLRSIATVRNGQWTHKKSELGLRLTAKQSEALR